MAGGTLLDEYIQYRIGSETEQTWGPPRDYSHAAGNLRDHLRTLQPGGFTWRREDHRWSTKLQGMQQAVHDLMRAVGQAEIGAVWEIRPAAKTPILRVRKVDTSPHVHDLPDTNQWIDAIYTVVWNQFKNVENWGTMVCKDVAGTSDPSQHCKWPSLPKMTYHLTGGSNAIDIHSGSADNMFDIWKFLISHSDDLRVENTIYNRRIWNPEGGDHPYTGINQHTDHVHADCKPTRSGRTLC